MAVSIAVLAPNFLLLFFPPRDPAVPVPVPRTLQWIERVGQALCLVVPAITSVSDIVWWWCAPAALALAAYFAMWIRYLAAGRRRALLYASAWRVPVPMAILPVLVWLTTAAWLGNPWIGGAAVVLAAGHIPVSLAVRRSLDGPSDQTGSLGP